jgi:hypothetical protein
MSRQIIPAVALALSCVGCASLPGVSKEDRAGGQERPDSILVDVLNENYFATRIHAVFSGGQRRSLGTIDGNGGRTRMALAWEPRALVFEVLLITEGATYMSLPVDVARGESIEVRVPQNIGASGFFRRVRRN